MERVDHGIRSVEDPALLRRLAADGTPLTVCPLSNVRLRCVPTIAAHPLPTLLDAGVNVTINSDDPAYFGGYVADNYLAIASGLGLDLTTSPPSPPTPSTPPSANPPSPREPLATANPRVPRPGRPIRPTRRPGHHHRAIGLSRPLPPRDHEGSLHLYDNFPSP